METKLCGRCKINQSVSEFGKDKKTKTGYRSTCNNCRRIESKIYREKNPEKRKETIRNFYIKNKDSELIRLKTYKEKNPEKRKETIRKYYNTNKVIINKKQVLANKKRYNSDTLYKLIHNLRCRTKEYLKLHNSKGKTFDIIGCSPQQLKEHIENKFTEGMCWDLLGKQIHIDHIIPLSLAKTEEEVYKLCHYTNLQPLWAKDNLSKGSKILI